MIGGDHGSEAGSCWQALSRLKPLQDADARHESERVARRRGSGLNTASPARARVWKITIVPVIHAPTILEAQISEETSLRLHMPRLVLPALWEPQRIPFTK